MNSETCEKIYRECNEIKSFGEILRETAVKPSGMASNIINAFPSNWKIKLNENFVTKIIIDALTELSRGRRGLELLTPEGEYIIIRIRKSFYWEKEENKDELNRSLQEVKNYVDSVLKECYIKLRKFPKFVKYFNDLRKNQLYRKILRSVVQSLRLPVTNVPENFWTPPNLNSQI